MFEFGRLHSQSFLKPSAGSYRPKSQLPVVQTNSVTNAIPIKFIFHPARMKSVNSILPLPSATAFVGVAIGSMNAIDAARAAKAGLGRGAPPPQRNAIEKLLLDLLKRPAASAGAGGSAAAKKVSKTSKILQSLVRARDGECGRE